MLALIQPVGVQAPVVRWVQDLRIAFAVRHGSGTGSTGLSWLLTDHLGSSMLTAEGSNATRLTEYRYKAWGETRYSSGTFPTNDAFTGQYFDNDISLYYYGAGWYDSSLGRFAQADSIVPDPGNPQSWDRYAYVNNNPLKYIDPSGHDVDCYGWDSYCKETVRFEKMYASDVFEYPKEKPGDPILTDSGKDAYRKFPDGRFTKRG